MSTEPFDWSRFHAYRVFDEFLERFILQRKSYITTHPEVLDLVTAFEDIGQRFVSASDNSDSGYEEKIDQRFSDAPEQTRIVFANVEYLWAMPVENLKAEKKRSYGERWFSRSGLLREGNQYYFSDPHTIADPGPYYLINKHWELMALIRVLRLVAADPGMRDPATLKRRIAGICHAATNKGINPDEPFAPRGFCGVHYALMHLADPDRYESIISESHRKKICAVFGHVVENPSSDIQIFLKQIRNTLYDSYGNSNTADYKYRWFFYTKDVYPLWADKQGKKEQWISSALFDVRNEEEALELEGTRDEVTGFRINRSARLVVAAKERDQYTCRACGFHFEDQIVHVHHLDPLSEYHHPRNTRLEDLLTLCPNCHYLAHYWLRKNACYKKLEKLLEKLKPG